MAATPREIVYQTLDFNNPPRAPRQLWTLRWAEIHHGAELKAIQEEFPADMIHAPGYNREHAPRVGDPHTVGRATDEWGAIFENIQEGVHGEVKEALIKDWDEDIAKVHVPREWLTIDRDRVNVFCGQTDRFVFGSCCPRPFEQLQFLRGTANLYMDLLMEPPQLMRFMDEMHRFYCELLETWCKTDVDAVNFMDDWGSQQTLLIDPALWEHHFGPMYRDYVQIAHSAGKRIFMHSDGHILAIYPALIEMGVDAVNSQIWCMGIDHLAPFAGRITFWGEIDRQHMLPEGTPAEIDAAVRQVYDKLWRHGGCIAQCEFGPGSKPENVRQVFASWDEVSSKQA